MRPGRSGSIAAASKCSGRGAAYTPAGAAAGAARTPAPRPRAAPPAAAPALHRGPQALRDLGGPERELELVALEPSRQGVHRRRAAAGGPEPRGGVGVVR